MTPSIYIYPTDTVWGIGGTVKSEAVYLRISEIKKHSPDKPVSVLFSTISMLREWVSFPFSMKDDFLEEIFSFETTWLIPKDWFSRSVPCWISQNSPFVGVRMLPFDHVKQICFLENAPIITTSLNLSESPPIVEMLEAWDFYRQYATDCCWINDSSIRGSGLASSIFSVDVVSLKPEISFVRRGRFAPKIIEKFSLPPA